MAEELEAGTAYLQLVAGAAGLQRDVEKKVKKVSAPDIIAKIDGEISGLEKKRAKAQQLLDSLREGVRAQADLDISVLEARKKVAEGKLAELDGKKASPEAELKTAKLNAELGRINASLTTLNGRKASPEVDAKVAKAAADVDGFDRKISTLNGRRAQVLIDERGAAATGAALDAVESKRRRVDGSRASVNIAAAGGAQASGMLGAVVAGLAAVISLAPAAGAALSTALAAGSGAAQTAGAVAAGFSGIGDAIKAVEADEKSAATTSAGAASSRTSSANQIASAQAALQQAVTQADRAAITGADQVSDANRSVARAVQQADRAQITSGQQVASARRAVSDAVIAAAERTSSAERAVGRAQDSARWAQEGLTRARKAAVEANQDLQLSLAGIAISERRADLALRKAIAARNSGGDVDPEMFKGEELDLDVAEAAQNLREVKERYGDLRDEQDQWARGGIDGSDQVVAAQRAVRDANLGVEDSVRSLGQAQRDGARQVQDASEQAALAQQQASWSIQDAQAGVTDAQIAAGRAARDAGWAQQDAARGVADAQRGLQQALDATAESAGGAGAAGKQSAWALSQLTPAGRSFVAFWTGEWKPAMQDVTDSVAGAMLPRVERGMRNLLGLQPELKAGLTGTGAVLGDLTVKGTDLATSPAFRASFVQIMDSNNRALSSWGNAALSGADSARVLTVAGLPLSERLARMAEGASQSAESFLLQKESTGELGRAMEYGADKAGQLVSVALKLAEAGYEVGVAIAPVGEVVLDVVSGMASFVAEFAEGNAGLVQFIATAGIAVAGTNALAKGIVAVSSSAAIAGGGLKTLWMIVSTGLNPAALYNTQLMTRVRDAAANAGPAISTYAQGLTGVRSSADGATKMTSGFAKVATGLSASLPLIGVALTGIAIANDAVNTSFDEGVEKMRKGGAAAEEFRAEMQRNDAAAASSSGVTNWLRTNIFGIQTTAEFTENLRKQADQWTNLEKAQYNASVAQGNYELIAKKFGATSMEAGVFLQQWRDATRDVEIAQIAVREKTDLATASMLYQRDQTLASIDADLRLRISKQQLAKDQQAVADAYKAGGANSQEYRDAQLQLEQTQLRTADAAKSSAGGQRAYVDSIRDMITTSNGQYTPTLAKMVASLDAAGLAAIGAKVGVNDLGQTVVTMPDGKTIVVDVNDIPARTGLDGVIYQLGQVPPGKTITVNAMTEPEKQKLIDLGFTVNTLPNGNVQVTASDAQARGTLIAFQMFAAWQVANPQLAADPAKAYGAMQGFLRDAGAQTGVPMLDSDPARADATVRTKLGEFNTWSATPALHVDTKPAEREVGGFMDWVNRWSGWNSLQGLLGRDGNGNPLPGKRDGGLIEGYASGGRIQHKQVFSGMAGGGKVRGPGGPRADRVPLMGSAGEFMVNAHAVGQPGVLPLLETINGMRDGGRVAHLGAHVVGYAGGGQIQSAAAPATTVGAVAVPSGDPAAAAAAAGATTGLADAMGLATGAAGSLAPQLAGVTAQQQAMVAAGVTPLAGALLGQLVPAVAAGNTQIGVAAPLAHQALQGAQVATQLSTAATAGNAAMNNAGMVATTTGMSLAAQAQHAGLRAGQQATQVSTGITAAQMAGSNLNMQVTTGQMRAVNEGHLAGLRGAQGVTVGSTVGFADAWRAQLGRTMPDSANPIRWVINYPIRGITDAWNHLDGQFALGKHVNPYIPGFASGGVAGVMPGYTPGRDDRTIRVGGGEAVMRPEWTSEVGDGYVHAANAAARSGGRTGVRDFLASTTGPGGRTEGRVKQHLMARFPLDDTAHRPAPGDWKGKTPAFAYGGVAPHVAAAGDEVTRTLGSMPGGIGGRGSRGNTSDHPFGYALDFMTLGNMALGDRVASYLQANAERMAVKYLIWKQAINGGRGWSPMENRGSPTANHFDHVHASFEGGPLGGMWGDGAAGGGGGFFDPTPMVEDAFKSVYAQIADVPKFFGPSDQVGRDQGVARFAADQVKGHAVAKLSEMFAASGGGGNVEQWRGVVLQALSMVGQPASLADIVLRRMNQESSGNPRSLNDWDVNAKAGWPTKGLMQMRDDTFLSNWDPRTPRNIWDPLANVVSSMRYAMKRYGSLAAAYNKAGGYHDGGRIPGTDEGFIFAQGGERVLSRAQNDGFERSLAAVEAGRFPASALQNVDVPAYDAITRLISGAGMQIDLGPYQPPAAGETHNHFFENPTIREEVDIDSAMQRAEFLASTSIL